MKIIQIPLLRDNYGYLIVCEETNEAAIAPLHEAKSNTDVFRLLAKKMGFEPELFEISDEQLAEDSLRQSTPHAPREDVVTRSVTTTLDQVKVLYLGGYLVMPGVTQDELIPVFAAARQRGVKTVLDIVVPAKGDYLSSFDPHLAGQ